MINLLLGLDEIHSKRLIHRDMKPENIMISEDDYLVIVDLGLVKMFDHKDKTYML